MKKVIAIVICLVLELSMAGCGKTVKDRILFSEANLSKAVELAGADGIGKLHFDDAHMANAIGSIAMAFILFSGGFDTSFESIKKVFLPGSILSSLGVLLTALFCGTFTYYLCKFLLPSP